MEPEKRIIKAKVKLLMSQPWFGQLASYLYPIPTYDISTAGINERGDLLYNPKFVGTGIDGTGGLTDRQLAGLLCHEVLHLAFQHPFRIRNRNPILWNIAADLKVNSELNSQSAVELPPGGLKPDYDDSRKFGDIEISGIDKKTSEQIYSELERKAPKFQLHIKFKGKGRNRTANVDCSGAPQPWKDLIDKMVKDLLESSGTGEVSSKDIRKFERQWKDRVNSTNQELKGDVPLGVKRELLALENPELPWTQIISQRLRAKEIQRSWKHVNKKWLPFYFPGRQKRKGLNAVVAIDTSGSMTEQDITKAISETWGMAMSFKSFKFHLVFNDAEIWKVIEVRNGNRDKILRAIPQGGGGTDFRPVFDMVKQKLNNNIDCLVFFTDGYGDFPEKKPPYDVYWVTESSGIEWPFGRVLKLKSSNYGYD